MTRLLPPGAHDDGAFVLRTLMNEQRKRIVARLDAVRQAPNSPICADEECTSVLL